MRTRERFAGSNEAADAAFLLGRLHADALSDSASAARYFDLYFGRTPTGGRTRRRHKACSPVTHRDVGDTERARQVASSHLAGFPERSLRIDGALASSLGSPPSR